VVAALQAGRTACYNSILGGNGNRRDSIAVIRKRELHRGTVMGKGDKGKGGSGTNLK